MATITPFVKRMRTQGGTIYTFSSALEDIGLNINERNNAVKMSHYALLNIPSIDAPPAADASTVNKFNVLAIPGAFKSWLDSGSIKDGRVIVAESFQNYALNLETNLLADTYYNPSLSTTVSERVFWKWLKETGAIRWVPTNTPAGTYWEEEIDTDISTGYNSVVKCVGTISAGSVRTDTFGTYNETYVLVPTSFGQSPVYFKQVEDDNYYHGWNNLNGDVNILGRESYTKPHPDGLDLKAYYDIMDSSLAVSSYNMYNSSDNITWNPGWWWTDQGFNLAEENSYFIDNDDYLDTSIFSTNLKYDNGVTTFQFKRSFVDCMSIEFDLDKLKNIMSDSTLTFDKMAIDYAEDDTFDFNAILIYYSVYNKTLDKVLATNLLGILFLDAASGSTQYYGEGGMEIQIPSITKMQSGATGFGTSYAFRLNVKSDYMIDDTQAVIVDETTGADADFILNNFGDVFDNLEKSLSILNQHTATVNFISEQYLDLSAQQTNILNELNDLEYQVNDIARDITGTENTIAMFADGDDPIVDSSIYMKYGNIGFFNNDPKWPVQIDASLKSKDIYIEKSIRDTSGNILLGYGSPLQIGSSTNSRELYLYASGSLSLAIDTSIRMSKDVYFEGDIIDKTGTIITQGNFISETSLGNTFSWTENPGYLEIASGLYASVSYVDGSLSNKVDTTDARLSDAREASDVYAWAKATTKPSYTYSEVGAAPASHNNTSHSETYITSAALSGYAPLTSPQFTNHVGIGIAPGTTYNLNVGGTIYASGTIYSNSDIRNKNITGTVENVLNLYPSIDIIQYTWKTENQNNEHYGFSAQNLNGIVPLVSSYNEELDKYEIDHLGISALNTQAIKELINENTTLKNRLSKLEKLLNIE